MTGMGYRAEYGKLLEEIARGDCDCVAIFSRGELRVEGGRRWNGRDAGDQEVGNCLRRVAASWMDPDFGRRMGGSAEAPDLGARPRIDYHRLTGREFSRGFRRSGRCWELSAAEKLWRRGKRTRGGDSALSLAGVQGVKARIARAANCRFECGKAERFDCVFYWNGP